MDLNMKIDLKDIDVGKVKAFLKRKETIIAIIVLIFIIAIIVIGNLLIKDYREATMNRDLAKKTYEKIIAEDTSIESLNGKINEANLENEKLLGMLSEISQKEVAEMLIKIQQDTGVIWGEENKNITPNSKLKDKTGLKAFTANITKFTATYEEVKSFLAYIKNMDRKVTIDSLSFSRDKHTGRMSGNMRLTFYYMINEEAT